MRIGVFVVGMHRSGTSAATRLVNLLGVPTCSQDGLMPVTDDNPSGYWESASLTAFNARLLDALGCDWSSPYAFDDGWHEAAALGPLRVEARALVARVLPTEQWVWKDPRNCVTFPFWAQALDVRPAVVLIHRNPLEVAESLGKRDGFEQEYGLALWERCVRLSLTAVSGAPVFVTTYAELLSEPAAWCEQVRAFLAPLGVGTGELSRRQVLDYVDDRLRHHAFGAEALACDPAVSPAQKGLYRILERLSGAHRSFRVPELPAETPGTEPLFAERRPIPAGEWKLAQPG